MRLLSFFGTHLVGEYTLLVALADLPAPYTSFQFGQRAFSAGHSLWASR
jgi:hypothetical protein